MHDGHYGAADIATPSTPLPARGYNVMITTPLPARHYSQLLSQFLGPVVRVPYTKVISRFRYKSEACHHGS